MVQAKSWIPGIPLTLKQVSLVAVGSALVYSATCIAIADLWVFPIPFLVVAGAPLMFAIWAIASRLVLGPRPLDGVQDGGFLGRQFLLLTSVHASLLAIYPSYQAVFLTLDSWMQLAMIALLPGLNLALKTLQTTLGSHLEDNLPEVITFSVDIFSAIYSVLCMHSANSMKMVGLALGLNTSVMLLSLHGMNRRSRVARSCRAFQLMERQQRRRRSVLDAVFSADGSPALLTTLVNTTLRLLQAPDQLNLAELRTLRLLSGMPQKLRSDSVDLLSLLAARCVYNNSRRSTGTISVAEIKEKYSSAAMEGRCPSNSRLSIPSPRSKNAPRLRGVFLAVQTAKWLSLRVVDSGKTTSEPRPERDGNSSKSTDSDESESDGLSRQSLSISSSTVVPSAPATSGKLRSLNSSVDMNVQETRKRNSRAVKQTLQLLFTNEYLGLIAYTQCVIPLIYLLYMPALQALPNHVYYPTHYRYFGVKTEFNERMRIIAILAALQFVLLVALQVAVGKRFGISTIHQVAFVLESRFALSQCRLLMWLIFAVQSTLVHYGVDFSFRFSWLHKSGHDATG
ncbi:hypothetical protein PF008_g18505 [Phytophthora fragariae]|uniref:Uncharacterized protein n=1 Tax=Phytophthora fragariae TaxID=53985 RepID=A0A6G0R5H2_9STRA|nr:hypothetical protein PF008_g18505 [Phytophthora fragariae]